MARYGTRYILTIFVLITLWHVASEVLGTNLLPYPHAVLIRLGQELGTPVFWGHLSISVWRITAGTFLAVVAAVPLGLILGSKKRLDRIFAPLIYLSYPVPKIVFLPIILLFFGLGDAGKIALIALIVFFQILIPTRDAVRDIEPGIVYSFMSLGGSGWSYYRHVLWPIALPGIFTSLRIGTGTAVAVLFFVESISTQRGIGLFLIDSWGRADYPGMFVGIVVLSVVGVVFYELFDLLEKRMCRWKNA